MDQVAIYIDFENIAISAEDAYGRCDIEKILNVAERYGRCAVRRAYGDWTRFSRYRQELLEQAIDLTQLFRYGNYTKKNSADIVMAVDVIEAALTNPTLTTFVLVTGDSDFTPVARKLRGYGRRVVGIGLRDATSDLLVRSCDEFVIYDALMERDEGATGYQLDEARQALLAALHTLVPRFPKGEVPLPALNDEMKSLYPGLELSVLGFRDLPHFLQAQKEIILSTLSTGDPRVALRSTHTAKNEIDQTLQYRTALNTAGFRLVEREIRQDVLHTLHALLQSEPAGHTLEEAVLGLKEHYDSTNQLRSRDDIQEVVRLIKQAGVLETQPESWELDTLTLLQDLAVAEFVRRCESVYVAALVQRNLTIDDETLARLLYGRADAKDEVRALRALVDGSRTVVDVGINLENGHQLPGHLAENPFTQVLVQDLLNWRLDEEASLEKAVRLNAQGLEMRTADFERARVYFLKAAKMMYTLMLDMQPGASLLDMEWYLASYCASTAGAHFSRHDYPRASLYYRAFFAAVKETEPVWDRVRKLIPPMLSFYFTIAPNEYNDLLKVAPGRTHPARLAVLLHNHSNEGVRRRWLELARDILRINPTLLRGIIQRLAFLEDEDQLSGARATRDTLTRLLNGEPVEDDPLVLAEGAEITTEELVPETSGETSGETTGGQETLAYV